MRFYVLSFLLLLNPLLTPTDAQHRPVKKTVQRVAKAGPIRTAPPAVAEATVSEAAPAQTVVSGSVTSGEGNAGTGRQLFNTMLGCSHCHGVNSVGHADNRNLRELKKRHSAEWENVFAKVMKEGRSGTAMPPWTHLSAKQVADLKAFLSSIQEE